MRLCLQPLKSLPDVTFLCLQIMSEACTLIHQLRALPSRSSSTTPATTPKPTFDSTIKAPHSHLTTTVTRSPAFHPISQDPPAHPDPLLRPTKPLTERLHLEAQPVLNSRHLLHLLGELRVQRETVRNERCGKGHSLRIGRRGGGGDGDGGGGCKSWREEEG